ncbi:beta transducin [Elasticomyces elasticus]|nr:beta transducin [Elasticomyces elasticus]KAK4970949.1 beta transducin [Elasticomyces elasticus]
MVRSYRRYEASHSFATICTASSNSLWTSSTSSNSGVAYCPANSDVLGWSIKKGELVSLWHDKDNASAEVTCLAQCAPAQPDVFAAGYSDGSIRIWDSLSGQIVVKFDGHRSAVTQLVFGAEGGRLVSGSRDTDIIVWDLLSETAEFRLRGHKDQITGLSFLQIAGEDGEIEEKYLISTSKDSLIKLWDLASPHCLETHVAQTNGECWALGMSPDGAGCITAGNDGELKVWQIDLEALSTSTSNDDGKRTADILTSRGILRRQGRDRTIGISFHPKQDYVAVHGSEKAVEIWRIRTADEVHRHLQRKRRRRREKAAAMNEAVPVDVEDAPPTVDEIFVSYVMVRTGGKVRSASWANPTSSNKKLELLVATTNNQLEMFTVTTHRAQLKASSKDTPAPEYNRSLGLDIPGHRTDIRTLALSSDDRMLASASAGQLKIWNLRTRSCLRTLECGQALCSTFLPGDRIVLLGTKAGDLELYDISTSTQLETIPAHNGQAIWAMALQPDGKGVVTGSADKTAKFWRFDVVDEEIPGTRRTTQRLKLTQTRELKLADDILSLCFSPDGRLLAVSTLDNTVKVFFTDSLKLFLTLYGHKLPVLGMSISSDSKVIATCSADKNIRVWGLDFGDCHKAFFAHNDSVMGVGFIPHPVEKEEGRLLFSVSKDGGVKTWDTEKFVPVQKLEGHKGEVWAMVVGRTGDVVVSAGHDKSVRVWEVGEDLVFLEEEREKEQEAMYEASLAQGMEKDARDEDVGDEEVAGAGKQTLTTLTHGEKVMEALEIGLEDHELMTTFARDKARNPSMAVPQRNPVFLAMGGISAEEHVLRTLRKVPSPALNDALLVIPFSTLPTLFLFLRIFLEKKMQPELAWRVTYFLLQAHMQQIVASRQLREVLDGILVAYEDWQEGQKTVVGFNLAGLDIMGRDVREREVGVGWVGDEVEEDVGVEKGRKKRAFGNMA